MDLVLFDLDNTLLSGDSDYSWAEFLISKGVLDREIQSRRNQEFLEQYQSGQLDIQAFLDFQLTPLAQHPRTQLDAWHREFMRDVIEPMISAPARRLVNEHLASDAIVAIVTATNSFVTGPIARHFGIPHLIATIPAQENGEFTGKVRGEPAFRGGKIVRVDAWLESMGLHRGSFARSWFYSDSHNDLPLLEQVTHPIAVDPDSTLEEHARRVGWPVISLR
jgi:HAD superfamily hydrolase (TIGR01490 family)